MNEIAITAIGRDRPGIVAGFTEVLLSLGCNLADCSMSLLRDQFAMILLVEAPDGVSAGRLDAALQELADDGIDLGAEQYEIAHHHRHVAHRLEGRPPAEGE